MKSTIHSMTTILAATVALSAAMLTGCKGSGDRPTSTRPGGGVESCPDTFASPPGDASGVQTLTFTITFDSAAKEDGALDLTYTNMTGLGLLDNPPSQAPFSRGDQACSFQVTTTGTPGVIRITVSRSGCVHTLKTNLTIH